MAKDFDFKNYIQIVKQKKQANEDYEKEISLIVSNCEKYICYNANLFNIPEFYKDDLKQEGRMAVIEAVWAYDEKYAAFPTFVSTCIRNRMNDYISRYLKKKFKDFDDISNIVLEDDKFSITDLESKTFAKECVEMLNKQLTEEEKNIIHLINQGFSYKEISNLLNITQKDVDNKLQKIKKQYKKLINP